MSDWLEKTLGDFVTLQRGHDLPETERRDGNVPVVGSFGITGYHDTAIARGPGVTVGRSGSSFGTVFFCSVDFWPHNAALYVTNFHGNDEKYAYYFLKTFDFTVYNSGSAQPSLNRNYLYPIKITVPPLAEQRAIAHILGSLDDKIELNRRMNATLEATARALFQSWFVDFDPVHAKARGEQPAGMDAATAALFPDSFEESTLGLIPAGWRVGRLDGIASYLNGLALQKYPAEDETDYLPVIKIRELRQGVPDDSSNRASTMIPPAYIVDDGDVLFSWSGSLLVDIWTGGKGALNQHLFKVTSDCFPRWFYYFWTLHYLDEFVQIAADKATTMGHIKRHHLSDSLVVVPNGDILPALTAHVEPYIEAIVNNRIESRTLAETRDALLPKLVSGEVRVPHP